MGSFSWRCAWSGIPIRSGDNALQVFTVKPKGGRAIAVSLPIAGKYDSYGCVEDVDREGLPWQGFRRLMHAVPEGKRFGFDPVPGEDAWVTLSANAHRYDQFVNQTTEALERNLRPDVGSHHGVFDFLPLAVPNTGVREQWIVGRAFILASFFDLATEAAMAQAADPKTDVHWSMCSPRVVKDFREDVGRFHESRLAVIRELNTLSAFSRVDNTKLFAWLSAELGQDFRETAERFLLTEAWLRDCGQAPNYEDEQHVSEWLDLTRTETYFRLCAKAVEPAAAKDRAKETEE